MALKLGTEGDLSAEGQREVTAVILLQPSFGVCEVTALLCSTRQLRLPFLLIFQNASIIREKGVVIGLLIEMDEANNFPQENNLKIKGNPNQNSRSSVERRWSQRWKYSPWVAAGAGEGGSGIHPGESWPCCQIPACPMTGCATAPQLKTWKQAWRTAKSVCSCKMNTYYGVFTLLLEYSVGLLSLMVMVFQLISSFLLFLHPVLFLISQIIFCYITYIEPINTWCKFSP